MHLFYQLALTRIKGVGDVLAKQLLTYCGSAEAVFHTPKKQLLTIPGIRDQVANAITQQQYSTDLDKELHFVQQHQIQVLFWTEPDYPVRLQQCADAPVLLYYKGNANLNAPRIVSVVGTRNATPYGKELCEQLISDLLNYEVLVVSGLAYGIDSYAHKACVGQGVPTVGVLGHGLDRIYPAANRLLASDMLKDGGLLTEYPSGTNPDRQNFPSRNRIIAGLADVTIVVEAALKGGALITAEIANTYNRDVCAFPGSINYEFSAGCNHLIKTHRAHLIGSAKDLAYVMNWEPVEKPLNSAKQLPLPLALDPLEQKIYDLVKANGALSIDELARRLNLAQSKLAIAILALEIQGVLVALPGKIYRVP